MIHKEDARTMIAQVGFTIVNEFQGDGDNWYMILTSKWTKGYFIAASQHDYQVMRLHKSFKFAYEEFDLNAKVSSTIKKAIELDKKNSN